MTAVHPTDAQLGERLLLSRVLFSLACNTVMVADELDTYRAVCDPKSCGWHWADIRVVAASFRRFEIPEGNVPDTVWVISKTSHVPGIIHRSVPTPRNSPE